MNQPQIYTMSNIKTKLNKLISYYGGDITTMYIISNLNDDGTLKCVNIMHDSLESVQKFINGSFQMVDVLYTDKITVYNKKYYGKSLRNPKSLIFTVPSYLETELDRLYNEIKNKHKPLKKNTIDSFVEYN